MARRRAFFIAAVAAGCCLALAGGFLYFRSFGPGTAPDFSSRLSALDALDALDTATSGGALRLALDAAAQDAVGVQSCLSVLKRARRFRSSEALDAETYADLAAGFARRFPHSGSLAALAAEAALSAGRRDAAGAFSDGVDDGELLPVAVWVRSSLASLDHPAEFLPESGAGSGNAGPSRPGGPERDEPSGIPSSSARPSVVVLDAGARIAETAGAAELAAAFWTDAVLERLVSGDGAGVSLLLSDPDSGARRSAAAAGDGRPATALGEAAFSLGDYATARSLFAVSGTSVGKLRAADAAYLAGDVAGARAIWEGLFSAAAGSVSALSGVGPEAAYSYAATSAGSAERTEAARQVLDLYPGFEAAAVLLSRGLADPSAAMAVLSPFVDTEPSGGPSSGPPAAGSGAPMLGGNDGLAALETLRRSAAGLDPWRAAPVLWLAFNGQPHDERFARWCAWRFSSAGDYREALRVAATYRRTGGDRPWMAYYEGLVAAMDGDTVGAETLFRRASPDSSSWRIAANLGAIEESRRNPAAALRLFETAISMVPDPARKSALLVASARQLSSLGRESDRRRVLEYALSLDPLNRAAAAALGH